MLDYAKLILLKVSFSRVLFEKELRKALKLLQPLEIGEFRNWCYAQFSRLYRRVLKRVVSAGGGVGCGAWLRPSFGYPRPYVTN